MTLNDFFAVFQIPQPTFMPETNFRKNETLFSALKIQHSKQGSKQQAKEAKEATTETTCHLS
jgi:hypothetical protein